jgi:hypothetical protein
MCAHYDDKAPKEDRRYVKALLEKRLADLHRRESRLQDSPLKSYYASQEAILEEVLRRARGHQDNDSLILIMDMCILESRGYQKLSTDRSLKTWYGIKVRVLRSARLFIGRYFHPRKWSRKKK